MTHDHGGTPYLLIYLTGGINIYMGIPRSSSMEKPHLFLLIWLNKERVALHQHGLHKLTFVGEYTLTGQVNDQFSCVSNGVRRVE